MNKTRRVFIFSITLTCFLSAAISFSAEILYETTDIPVPKRFLDGKFTEVFAKMRESYTAGEFSKAADECEKIIGSHPDDKDVLLYAYSALGEMRHRDKDYQGALEAYKKALNNFPANDRSYQLQLGMVRTDMASIYIETDKYEEASAILLKHIEEYPEPIELKIADSAKAVEMLKMCFPQEADKDKLFRLLDQLREEYKGKRLEASILYELASFYEDQRNYGLAVGRFREVANAFPNNKLAEKAEGRIWRHKADEEYLSRRDKSYEDITADASSPVPMGLLGYPLGTYLTIEGASGEWTEKMPNTLFVYRVNGERLPMGLFSMQIWIDNASVGTLPKGTRCILRGYETGEMRGVPSEIIKKERLERPEEPWGFYRYFVVTSVITPSGLKIEEKTTQSWAK
jgi:tetratricopeptide (TPR) repeat protein